MRSARDLIMGQPQGSCPEVHSMKGEHGWTWGTSESYGIRIQCDGRVQHRVRCNRCGAQAGPIPIELIRSFGSPKATWVERSEPREYEPCCFLGCTQNGEDMHHFAPRNTFGSTADSWPVLPVCKEHHREWHQTMN